MVVVREITPDWAVTAIDAAPRAVCPVVADPPHETRARANVIIVSAPAATLAPAAILRNAP